ncbi:MAG TPA: deoxyribodipyrimidine photo-lyase [Candidatus Nanopelagicales bacterium]|nr:deoxyribodipyrimidine photo-lyase [Candidatus Nanopelagicales bacterium]
MASVLWFRRDLRLGDNPALLAAVEAAREDGDGQVVPLFVVDPRLWDPAGPVRQRYLVDSLDALGASMDRNLLIRHGDPREVIPEVVRASGASSVHIAADYGPYGTQRDLAVEAAIDVPLVRTGSPYAIAPGRITKADGTPYRVYTPFYRAWLAHGWRAPAGDPPSDIDWWMPLDCQGRPQVAAGESSAIELPPAGERAALERWENFRADGLANYDDLRNRADLAGTSSLSHHLKYGEIHPRTILADLTDADDGYRREICFREFYADVLQQNPRSAAVSLDERFDTTMRWENDDDAFAAWAEGRTGFPFVDAGMRQLRAEGWVHNRVRMVVASFLVKDLHQSWQRGAGEFMYWLRDGDVASNSHGWQWTAGCGTDASPFYRVFNPVTQGLKFDPDGDYVRRYIPELRHLPGKTAHEPWDVLGGYDHGYPDRIVDHKTEREAALADFAAIKRT